MRTLLLSIIVFLLSSITHLSAQLDSNLTVSLDIFNRYVWRGVSFGGSPSLQPGIDFSKSGFSAGVWGAYTTNGNQTQEFDLYLSYTVKEMFTISVTDYFLPNDTCRNKYFNFNNNFKDIDAGKKQQTGHVVEASVSFNGTESIPISLLFAINVYGVDSREFKKVADNYVPDESIVYTKYAEIGYSKEFNTGSLSAFCGVVLDDPREEYEQLGYYGQNSWGVINLGLSVEKEIEITDKFSLPVSSTVVVNPESENVFLLFGISLSR